ncbi:hypothetical protein [Enterococcus cecorum]|uniref:Uncharacterized protein n=1 Tax=Enterococcus cecorum TaxID=44008 RepID=A0A200HMV0_9ENTE|nr:hypothetical protein [Enterococcus cecorum]KLO66428.1 hypothetical protein AA986_06485 [Enterococcus cecorum]MCJ0538724.1 hypothetical protein [Enterococcus cecorum]MCJ0547233.1 hypothetical protein [Enterococcus cecorum]MCJ0551488.1 hypothetical protein [Enterococcus cecorum]MCJ0569752.1 hypothetical protein [Enterococcus cecorum]
MENNKNTIFQRDLRYLATFGNATAKLDAAYKHRIADIRKDGLYVPQGKAIIDGRKADVKINEPFYAIIKHIVTIKVGNLLVAETLNGKLVKTDKFSKLIKTVAKSNNRKGAK